MIRTAQLIKDYPNAFSSGWLAAFLTTLNFSLMSPITKFAVMQGIDPTTLQAFRYLLATFLMWVTIRMVSPKYLYADRRAIMLSMAAGLAYCSAVLSFTWSLRYLDVSLATMIFAVYPLFVLLMLAARGEPITSRQMWRLLLGLLGIYLLIGPGGDVEARGILLMFVCSISFALYLVIMQWHLQTLPPLTTGFYIILATSLASLGMWLFEGAHWQPYGWQAWATIGWMAIIGTYVAQLMLLASIRMIGCGQFSLLGPLETLLTVWWSMAFLGEQLTWIQWGGGFLIILSMWLAVFRLPKWRHL